MWTITFKYTTEQSIDVWVKDKYDAIERARKILRSKSYWARDKYPFDVEVTRATSGDKVIDEELPTKVSVSWCAEDVQGRADEMGVQITKEQIGEVLYLIVDKHDASLGITWDTIDFYISEVTSEED